MTELLHNCPNCGRENFTARGLKAHVCRPDRAAAPSPMSKAKTPKNQSALVVLSDGGAIITDKKVLAKFQAHTASQLALIHKTESENVLRRIFVGLALWRIKASLKHGEFGPWLKKHVAAGHNQVNLMMRAATAFIDSARLAKPEVLALTGSDHAIEPTGKDAASQKIVAAAEKFVGDLTWGELLDKHSIRDAAKLGGKRTPEPEAPAEAPDEEQMYQLARDEIGGALTRAEELLVKENRLQFLAKHPEEVRGVVTSLRALADRVEAAAKPILGQQSPA